MSQFAVLQSCLLLLCFTTCNGQNTTQSSDNGTFGQILDTALGETVTEVDKNIWFVFQDRKKNFWFGSDGNGAYRFDGKSIICFSTKQGLCNDHIRDIQEDKKGNIYFTTIKGISKFDGQKFTLLTVTAGNDPHNWQMGPDDLWFISEDGKKGPYRYDGKALYSLQFPKSALEDEYYRKYPNSLIDPYAQYYIYKDRKGIMWFGTGALGVYRFDGASVSSMYEDHLTLTKTGGSFGIRSIMEDRTGKFWICNTKFRYNILPGNALSDGNINIKYRREKGIDISNDPLGDDRMYFQSAAEDSTGSLWLQTYIGGIWRYDGKTVQHYPVKDGNADAKVIRMYQDRNGGLWLATDGAGVYKFNEGQFEKFKIN